MVHNINHSSFTSISLEFDQVQVKTKNFQINKIITRIHKLNKTYTTDIRLSDRINMKKINSNIKLSCQTLQKPTQFKNATK